MSEADPPATKPGNGGPNTPPASASVTPIPAPPPPPVGASPQAPLVQFAQQIFQQTGSLNEFSLEIQRMIIEGLQQQDRFSFEIACKNIDHEDKKDDREVTDRARGRKQLLVLFVGILVLGGIVDAFLIYKGQYQLATHLLSYGGTSIVSALGGFGISRTKTFGGGTKSD